MVNKRKLRKLERELTEENGEGLDLNVKTLHQLANGELDPSEMSEEALEKVHEMAKFYEEVNEKKGNTRGR